MSITPPPELISAIAADLYDDAPRLVLADWLEAHGDLARAEFIRVQCALEPIRDRYEDPRAVELHERESELHQEEWDGALPDALQIYREGPVVELRRGLPDTLLVTARDWLEQGAALRQRYPTLRRVVLFRVQGYGERLAASEAFQGLAELELACWYSDEDAMAIASSPHLSSLQVLEIWLARAYDDDEVLCEIMARGTAWPRLRQLVLLDPDGGELNEDDLEQGDLDDDDDEDDEDDEVPEPGSRKALVEVADRTAGRPLARYQRGYPETFPLAPDFYYVYPGRLPDGRACLANEDTTTTPPTICVLTFDEDGHQTDEILRVPLPEPMLAVPSSQWHQHKELVQQQLIEHLGFQPAFIRIRGCRFPGDDAGYDVPFRGHDDWWEEMGLLDDEDDEVSQQNEPWGSGGRIYWLVRNGEYEFGWDRWADKRGRVHST